MIGHVLIDETTMTLQDCDPYSAIELCDGAATYECEENGALHTIYFDAAPGKGGGEYCLHTHSWTEMKTLVDRLPFKPRQWPA